MRPSDSCGTCTETSSRLRETEARLREASDQIAQWSILVEEVKQLASKLQSQFAIATSVGPLTRAHTLLDIAERCRRDADSATLDRTGVRRETLMAVADGARELARLEVPLLTKSEIEAALRDGTEAFKATRAAMDKGGFIPS